MKELNLDTKRLSPRSVVGRDLGGEERDALARRLRRDSATAIRTTDASPRSTTSTTRDSCSPTPWTSTTCSLNAVAMLKKDESVRSQLSEPIQVPAGRRVPGHQRRAEPAGDDARREAPQPLRGRRLGPVDLPIPRGRRAQHPAVRAALPRRRRSSCSSRTSARPRRSSTRPTPSSRRTPVATRRTSSPTTCRARRSVSTAPATSTTRAAGSRPNCDDWRPNRSSRGIRWPSSTAPTPRAASSKKRCCAPRSRTASSRACASTTAKRSRTRWPSRD